MKTESIEVAPDVALAVDRWPALATAAGGSPRGSFVLVHGLASNARLWDGVAERLNDCGADAFTVDLRGHGRSSKPDDGYDVATVADDLAELLRSLGVAQPIVVGQSWGGNVVVELAARHPEIARGIVCVDGGWIELRNGFSDWESCREALQPPHLVGRPLSEIEGYVRASHPDWPETGIRGTLANFEVRSNGTIAPWLTFNRHILVLRGLWEHHPSERYAALSVPVLLAPAERDDLRTEARRGEIDAAAAAIPRSAVLWFRGDHDIHAQHPVELADAMLKAASTGVLA